MNKRLLITIWLMTLSILALANRQLYENYIVIKYLLNQNKLPEAEKLVDAYLKHHPQDPFILSEKAFIQFKKKNHQEAIKFLNQSLTIYPEYYYTNYLKALALFSHYTKSEDKNEKELLDSIIKLLKQSIADNDQFFNSLFLLGTILSENKLYYRSNHYLNLANKLNQTPETYYKIASNYHDLNEPINEMNTYEKILKFAPYDFRSLYSLSQIYLEKKEFKKASLYLGRLYQMNPQNQRIGLDYLHSLFASHNNEKFLEISNSVKIDDFPMMVYAKISILNEKKRFKEADEILKALVQKKPNKFLADIYNQKQDYFQAYQILQKVEGKNKDSIYYSILLDTLSKLSLNGKIIHIFQQIKTDQAIISKLSLQDFYHIIFASTDLMDSELISKIISQVKELIEKRENESRNLALVMDLARAWQNLKQNPILKTISIQFEVNRYLLVNFLKKNNQFEKAIAILKSDKNWKKTEQMMLEICDIYLQQKNVRKVEKNLVRLREKHPSSAMVNNFYAYFLALQNKKLNLAQQFSKYTLTQDGENPAYLDTYGYILLRQGKLKESGEYLKKAYAKNPLEPDIIDHIVSYYERMNNHDKIIEIYSTAIANEVDFKTGLQKKLDNARKN